jgi:hypothetical protein
MSDRIVLDNPEIGRILARRARCEYGDLSTNIARVKDQTIMGGAIYQGFTGESVTMHTASFDPRWMTRDLCWVGHHYPFVQLGVKRIFGQVPEDNLAAQKLNLHAGFKTVARIEGVYEGGVACLVMVLEKADSRFLKWMPRKLKSNVLEDA